MASVKFLATPLGTTISLGSNSGMINRTAAQFASDGTDKVYIGSNNYGWNDSRDWATQFVDVDSPVLNQNDQYSGMICPVDLASVSIKSQVRMNAANGQMQCRVYKMNRANNVNTSNLTLTQIGARTINTTNGRFMTLDIECGAVAAGQLIVVGFGKTDGGNGQKPRFNYTLTGITS